MKIKQVEELVGITKKNIRFYEEQGLLSVARAENGYREYHEEDIKRLQKIKLLRKVDISIEEMKKLFEGKESLEQCLELHVRELEHRREDLQKMQELCEGMMREHLSLDSLDAENCLEDIEQLEKEGARFMNVNKTDVRRKKRTGGTGRCSSDDCIDGVSGRADAVGQYAGAAAVWNAGSFDCNSSGDLYRDSGSACRKNERD